MKRLLKKSVSLLLCLAVMFSACSVSFIFYAAEAEDNYEVMPLYTTIEGYVVDFNVSGLTAIAAASLSSQVSTTLKITIYLQKETSNGYETIETWTATRTGAALALEESKIINPFNNYRIKVNFVAGSESINVFRYE